LDKDFTSFLKAAIASYESDPEAAWNGIYASASDARGGRTKEELQKDKSLKRDAGRHARKALRKRLLEQTISQTRDEQAQVSARGDSIQRSTSESYLERWAEEQSDAFIQKVVRVMNLELSTHSDAELEQVGPITREELLARFGKENVLALQNDPGWQRKEREHDLQSMSIQTHLARRFADWLDLSAGKIEEDGAISFRNAIPEHLRHYMYEAHWCNLHGLDGASTALCGSILEEALREKLKETGRHAESLTTLGSAIEAAGSAGIGAPHLTGEAKEWARTVMTLRNSAVHHAPDFAKSEIDKKIAFSLTSKLLETLYPAEN
jgi:hypothetical protein